MPPKKIPSKPAPPAIPRPTPLEQAFKDPRHPPQQFQTVSPRWLLSAAAISILAATLCAWGVLCFLFWQGSWQLLYHPAATIARTPAAASLAFESIAFAPNDSGIPQLAGWWIPANPHAPYSRFTVLYFHSQDGNLSATIDDLAFLHSIGLNVFAIDYRGYGQSQPAHPSEAHWNEDAGFALTYLTETRHVPRNAILLEGKALGANLALEFAASHPDLAGVILDQPLDAPMSAVFNDPRSALVPAHLLVRDSYDAEAAASALRIPSLWLENQPSTAAAQSSSEQAYASVSARKTLVWLNVHDPALATQRTGTLTRWLDDVSVNPARP